MMMNVVYVKTECEIIRKTILITELQIFSDASKGYGILRKYFQRITDAKFQEKSLFCFLGFFINFFKK